jgi:hypothetical protein
MRDFASHPAFEIARRLELRGKPSYSWIAVLGGDASQKKIHEFAAEIRLVTEAETRILKAYPVDLESLKQHLNSPPEDTVILLGLDRAGEAEWASLDVNRSALERPGALIFWLSLDSIARLNSQAPNLRSFMGGTIFVLSAEGDLMTEEELNNRLASLRAQFSRTDSEVIRLAEEGKLPPEPDFAEWLVLLGRGDLL